MNILLNANTVTENIAHYEKMSRMLLILAIVFAVITVILGVVFKISKTIRVLSGMGSGKEIKKISQDTQAGMGYAKKNTKAIISWGGSNILSVKSGNEETTVLQDENTSLLEEEGTSVLKDNECTTVLSSGETEVLADGATTVLSEDGDAGADIPLGVQEDFILSLVNSPVENKNDNPDFEIEEEIIITGNMFQEK
jgi:hypothetical protein